MRDKHLETEIKLEHCIRVAIYSTNKVIRLLCSPHPFPTIMSEIQEPCEKAEYLKAHTF